MPPWFTLTFPVAFYASEWIVRLIMLVVVTRRQRRSAAVAWLLIIFIQPWVGLGFYLLIGEPRLSERRKERLDRLLKEIQALGRRFEGLPDAVSPKLEPEQVQAVKLAHSLGSLPILGGNSIDLMTDTVDVIDRMVADIDAAKHHVHLLFYIYGDDVTGRRVRKALIRAKERGVECRVLVDAVGSSDMMKSLAPEMVAKGIEVKEALPVTLRRMRTARMDIRNHRKVAVIDGKIGYTGSQNIIDADYGHKDLAWHDMMARFRGPIVLELQAVFIGDWYIETDQLLEADAYFPEPQVRGDVPAQALPSGPNFPTANYQRMIVAAIHAAQSRVVLTTPYFVPDEAFLQALEVAVLRGVRVDLVMPKRSDQLWVGAASRSYYESLLQAGVRLYLYEVGLLHAKTLTIDDDIAMIGSSNFDIRSFSLNFELNMVLYGAAVTAQLREMQVAYLDAAKELTLEEWNKRHPGLKLFQNIARLMGPLL